MKNQEGFPINRDHQKLSTFARDNHRDSTHVINDGRAKTNGRFGISPLCWLSWDFGILEPTIWLTLLFFDSKDTTLCRYFKELIF